MDESNDILDVRRAAIYLDITQPTLRRLVRNGTVPAKKVGKAWRFSRSQLAEWIRAGEVKASP